jgi:Cu/Zn superoxide dismutase
MWARLPHSAGALAALAVLALALLGASGHAQAVGEVVEAWPANVFEGERFHANVTVPSLGEPTSVQVHVGCPSCGAGWTTAPLANWRQVAPGSWRHTLDFPSSLFPGSAQGQPIWAGNWTVRVAGSSAAANVTVHATDAFLRPDATYEATEAVKFRVAGVPPGGSAFVNISKWTRTGAFDRVVNLRLAATNGIAEFDWRIPKEHAADMGCPEAGRCRDYSATITAGSKVERVEFKAKPAALQASITYLITNPLGEPLLPLGPGPLAFNRTENVTIQVDAQYHNGARLTQADRSLAGNASLNGTLKLAVERVSVATSPDGNQSHTLLERTQLLYAKPFAQGWRAEWHIPRNLTITQQGADNPQYRVRILFQEDRYTNDVPDTNGTAFRVHPLRIAPQLVGLPQGQVERLTNATAIVNIRYADGSPWTNSTNATSMRASLVDEEGDTIAPAALTHVGAGTWRVSYQPGIKHKPLGFHLLRIHANEDAHDNVLQQTDTPLFELVEAKPRITLSTKVGHQTRGAEDGFARGDRINVVATIAYADGTPYDLARLPAGQEQVVVNITKRDAKGEVHGHDLLALKPMEQPGQWGAAYAILALNGSSPLGPWEWRFALEDRESPPNRNTTHFVRPVKGAAVEVELLRAPEPLVRSGEPATLRFQARYPWPVHALLTDATAGNGIVVLVQPWKDGKAHAPVAVLHAAWDAERLDWHAVWHTNRTTIVGSYVLNVTGFDHFGNLLPGTLSRPLEVFVDTLQRQVLREPGDNVTRGESALVIFDGAEGDLGEEGWPAPRIEVQKWNPLRKAWEKERTDVRSNDTGGSGHDHRGLFETDGTTNLGQYRFALVARNDQHAIVTATSRTFRVLPVEVERQWLPGAEERVAQGVAKGDTLILPLERKDGDQVVGVSLYKQGERVANGTVLLKTARFEVTVRTSFTLPDGAYTVQVRGRDLHNNTFLSPPLLLNLTGVGLQAKIPAPPPAAFQRADRLELRALIQYPDETLAKEGQFTARFVLGNSTVAERSLVVNRSAWLLNWTPPADAPLGAYRVLVRGEDGLGNQVEDQEVYSFALAEGVLERSFTFQRTLANRTENIVWVLPATKQDASIRFFLREDSTGTRKEVQHNLTVGGDYVVQWRPARDEKLTRYTLTAEGMDTGQNAILATSRSLLLRPAPLGVAWFDQPGRTLQPGQEGRWEFQLLYPDGTPVPADEANKPLIGIVGPSEKLIPDGPRAEPDSTGTRWIVTWTHVPGQHPTAFKLAIGGKDQHGNELRVATASGTVRIDEGLLKTYLNVPGVEAALLPVVLMGAALWLRKRPPGQDKA